MFCWSLLGGDPEETPFVMGVTDDLTRAQHLAEPYLGSGRADVCLIESVRLAMTVHDLSTCYMRTGRFWVGRRLDGCRVTWSENAAAGWAEPLAVRVA